MKSSKAAAKLERRQKAFDNAAGKRPVRGGGLTVESGAFHRPGSNKK